MKNFYQVMGIPSSASLEDIKKAYRKLVKKHHPDVNAGSRESEEKFKEIQEAYKTLSNPALREAYDAKLNNTNFHSNTESTERNSQNREKTRVHHEKMDFNNINQNFENFFGFNPKTKDTSTLKERAKKNPLDTTSIFESFFGKK